jgi:hypothetical protein
VITVGAMKAMKTLSRCDDQMASHSSNGPSVWAIEAIAYIRYPAGIVTGHPSTDSKQVPRKKLL